MKYKYILFDLDGTLTNPCEGITKSVQFALEHFGIYENDIQKLTRFIGPPLKGAFTEYYGLSDKDADKALEKYRERFSVVGWKENLLLEGADLLLEKLKKEGYIICLATSKPHIFANKILELFDIMKYFDFKVGSELDGRLTDKAEVIKTVINHYSQAGKEEFLMVGDRSHDIVGAKKNGIDSCGILLGFGSEQELKEAGADYVAENFDCLYKILNI